MGAYMLAPLFVYQQSGQYPNKWSIHDLGSSYPTAGGHNDGRDEAMQVEESGAYDPSSLFLESWLTKNNDTGNMIIMALSYAQKSGDNSQLSATYNLLKQWAEFLVTDSLVPGNQYALA